MTTLITGAAGFIGFHLALNLLKHGHSVIGLDNLNSYYDLSLKRARLKIIEQFPDFRFHEADLTDQSAVRRIFDHDNPERVVHLAAQAGVRYSLTDPEAYAASNLVGFLNILEACRHRKVGHLVYASSSSVYGANTQMPFSTHHNVDHPLSLYAATKKANELMAHSYSHLYGLPTTGLRFFTVYGPWGRPDMALFIFTKAILEGTPLPLFNHGHMERDFTYVDDIVEGIVRVTANVPRPNADWNSQQPDPATSKAPYRIYNIGNNKPEELLYVVRLLEEYLGRKAHLTLLPMQPGDVQKTSADIEDLMNDVAFRPSTPIEVGIRKFTDWYQDFYRVE